MYDTSKQHSGFSARSGPVVPQNHTTQLQHNGKNIIVIITMQNCRDMQQYGGYHLSLQAPIANISKEKIFQDILSN